MTSISCHMCGSCCVVYSISSLKKAGGVPCRHLLPDGRCGDYNNRPQVCRDFKADALCELISTLSDENKRRVLKKVYMED